MGPIKKTIPLDSTKYTCTEPGERERERERGEREREKERERKRAPIETIIFSLMPTYTDEKQKFVYGVHRSRER